MAVEIFQKNDIGTIFYVTIKKDGAAHDISDATTKTIMIQKPSGTVDSHAADFYTDGSDGILEYTGVSGDLSEIGEYNIQGKIITDDGTWYSDVDAFFVRDNLA